MIKKLFSKIGINLTSDQVRIIKLFGWLFIAVLINISIMHYAPGAHSNCTKETINTGKFISSYSYKCESSFKSSDPLLLLSMMVIYASALIPLTFVIIRYMWKILFNKQYREKEMVSSVNYQETDEREQLLTMKATKRSYMVLNFAILISWLLNLLMGHTTVALWLFIIQLVGAISYRHHINPSKVK
jgi:hypothetical protein